MSIATIPLPIDGSLLRRIDMKTIVTHIGPDLDAISAIWLVKTFFSGWDEAALAFVPAGTTLGKNPPDEDPEILHVDTGLGKFDHHQSDADTCAARLVYEEIAEKKGENVALERMVLVVNDIDHFREVYFPNPTADYHELGLVAAIDGWRLMYPEDPLKIVFLGMDSLDGIYKTFQSKVAGEIELTENGSIFDSKWGKGIGIETSNDETVHLAQKMGYVVVVRKDPKKGSVRIKALPRNDIDLTPIYDRLKSEEPTATWFLHASRHMVLNGSSKNPDFVPSTKSLTDVITLVTSV